MLIFIVHGSHDTGWRASVETLIQSLQSELGHDKVRLAYMDCTPPTLADVVAEAVDAGITRFSVMPLFLSSQGHVDRDIQPLVEEIRSTNASIDIELLPPMGHHPAFRDLLHKFIIETTG